MEMYVQRKKDAEAARLAAMDDGARAAEEARLQAEQVERDAKAASIARAEAQQAMEARMAEAALAAKKVADAQRAAMLKQIEEEAKKKAAEEAILYRAAYKPGSPVGAVRKSTLGMSQKKRPPTEHDDAGLLLQWLNVDSGRLPLYTTIAPRKEKEDKNLSDADDAIEKAAAAMLPCFNAMQGMYRCLSGSK